MIRKTILILCGLGAIGTALMWSWSSWATYAELSVALPGKWMITAEARDGTLSIICRPQPTRSGFDPDYTTIAWELAGFAYESAIGIAYESTNLPAGIAIVPYERRSVRAPIWFILVLFSAYPLSVAIALPRLRRRQRLRNNLCLKCGYPLKGLTEPRCPECNTAFDSSDVRGEETSPVRGDRK